MFAVLAFNPDLAGQEECLGRDVGAHGQVNGSFLPRLEAQHRDRSLIVADGIGPLNGDCQMEPCRMLRRIVCFNFEARLRKIPI